MGKIMFYVLLDVGYKQLLCLLLMKVKRKSVLINVLLKEFVVLYFFDIVVMLEEEGFEVKIVDFLILYLVIGVFGYFLEDKEFIVLCVQKVVLKYGKYIDVVGIFFGVGENVIYVVKEFQLSVILFFIVYFVLEDDYDDYCVKVVVYCDEEVLGFLFKKLDEKVFIYENSSVVDFY